MAPTAHVFRLGGPTTARRAAAEDNTRPRRRRRATTVERPPTEREIKAQRIAGALDPYLTILGIVWLIVWTVEPFLGEGTKPALALEVTEYAVWAVFIVEFVARVVVAPDTREYLRRFWWEVIILALPFLRFVRLFRVVRLVRGGRAIPSALRAARSAEHKFAGRVGVLSVLSVMMTFIGGRLLFEYGSVRPYTSALRSAVLAALAGQPIPDRDTAVAGLVEIVLIAYSVLVFAGLAATVGAYLLNPTSRIRMDEQ